MVYLRGEPGFCGSSAKHDVFTEGDFFIWVPDWHKPWGWDSLEHLSLNQRDTESNSIGIFKPSGLIISNHEPIKVLSACREMMGRLPPWIVAGYEWRFPPDKAKDSFWNEHHVVIKE